jgi:RNA polymerase sigma-70 factor (ECF subfamily)
MLNNKNLYTLRTDIVDGITLYYVSFTDGQFIHREAEVSRPIYLEFLRFVKIERSLRHWDERHREYSELTDETLYSRALTTPKSLEETIVDSLRDEHLRLVIQQLPKIQRRRFVLHHEFGLTYEQIATMQGCSTRAIEYSVSIAKEKIKKYFEK